MNQGRLALRLALVVLTAGASCRSGATPAGARAPVGGGAGGPAPACVALAPAACAARADCAVVTAQPADASGRCLHPPRQVACRPADQGCDDVLTFALGPDGGCVRLADACLPAGYRPPPADHACAPPRFDDDRPCP